MAASLPLLLFTLLSLSPLSFPQPNPLPLNPTEQQSLYQTLETLNPTLPWRTLFPDDLCLSPPHGILCDLFPSPQNDAVLSSHIVELNFGIVSDFSSNPPCSPDSTFPLPLLSSSSFPYLRKLFFYNCFNHTPVPFPDFTPGFGSDLEELVFIDNNALFGTLSGAVGNLSNLRRLIVTGSRVSGPVPIEIGRLSSLEQLTLSGNNLEGEIPPSIGDLWRIRVLDLSNNGFEGPIPESIGRLKNLLKLDFSTNGFSGKIPESFKGLKNLEFLDLSYNRFGGYGVPLFLGEMLCLKEVYLSGNQLGGRIPEIWENMGGILGIGFSGLGLVGNIPASMGAFLGNVVYIGLDNNNLDGSVPKEFGMLERVYEINLENNRLSGRVPLSHGFISRLGGKLKLQGNPGLCVGKEVLLFKGDSSDGGKIKACKDMSYVSFSAPVVNGGGVLSSSSLKLVMSWYLVLVLVGFWSFCVSYAFVT